MWEIGWRDRVWSELDQPWDVIVIGGGITGAGILQEAVRANLRALLLEARDFSSGTSSRSSKLVHGGLRYLRNAQIKTTLESVKERERLLREGRGLINRLGFLHASLKGDHLPSWMFRFGLIVYDLLAGQWSHRHYDALDMRELCPPLTTPDLRGGYRYFDAHTDDARLVLSVIREAVRKGGIALNYAPVESLLRDQKGQVRGVLVRDRAREHEERLVEIHANAVINATGAWADQLRAQIGEPGRLRNLRGSHLVIPFERLPLRRAVSFLHPSDGRPVFAIPWEDVTIFGTTDVDHGQNPLTDPGISTPETVYLLEALQSVFPGQELSADDVQATWAGIRAVVDTGKVNPSKESREHVIWQEDGLLTVSGGKLTTFRLMARDALNAVIHHRSERSLSSHKRLKDNDKILEAIFEDTRLSSPTRLRLLGRYGPDAIQVISAARQDELTTIGLTPYLWAELRWAARDEGILHLDDLLLRRIRLGLLLPGGGKQEMVRIRAIVQAELGWDDSRWKIEEATYWSLWNRAYSPP